MDRTQFWKNFQLGIELEISGTFIYDALRTFHDMESFHFEAEVFEFLYKLSVGIERLLKVAVVLVEHDIMDDAEKFEATLITHSHRELVDRLRPKYPHDFSPVVNSLIGMLGEFYKSQRYDRYLVDTAHLEGREKQAIRQFFEQHLSIEINDITPFEVTRNEDRFRIFIGKHVGKLVEYSFDVIEKEATRLGIFTYEIRSQSKAAKIFLSKSFLFRDEEVLWKELFIFLIKQQAKLPSGFKRLIDSITPLDFDPAMVSDYLRCFGSDLEKSRGLDELESYYEDCTNVKQRLELLEAIGNPNVYFHDEDDDDSQ